MNWLNRSKQNILTSNMLKNNSIYNRSQSYHLDYHGLSDD
jgi:hypothetical protein